MDAIERDHFDTAELVLVDDAPVVEDRAEPMLASVPILIEFDEPVRLDPTRVGLLWELPPQHSSPIRPRGPVTSLLIHLLPLLTLIAWPSPALELPKPIPVQLVIEQPPPPPPPAEQPPQPQQRPSGPLASEDFGDVKPKDPGTTTSEAPAAAGEKQPEAAPPTQTAHLVPPPPPIPPPKPAPPKESAIKLPKPPGLPLARHEETPHEAPHAARYPGPAASRDEYLAYLAALTRQHIDMLPMSVVGSRRGATVVAVLVQGNGTISRISIARSSGYRDIDERVERMVTAVGRFPPLPQWFQGNVMELELTVQFPEALYR